MGGRGGRGGSGYGSGYGRGRYNDQNDDKPDRSDASAWRRGPSAPQPSFQSPSSFNTGPPSDNRSTFGSGGGGDRSSFGAFRSNNNDRNDNMNDFGASESDTDWRRNKKPKEQPKISLNSTISPSNNVNPWNASNADMKRSSFGSKSQSQSPASSNSFNRNAFGSKSNDSYTPRSGGFGSGRFNNDSNGMSKFNRGRGGASKFGSASTSKFNTGGGFGAAALKNIDNGNPRLSYTKNNRFAAIMDDNSPKNNSVSLQLPSKVQSNRFANVQSAPSTQQQQQQSYPGLDNGNKTITKRIEPKREKTTTELQKEYNDKIRRDKARKNAMNENKENENKEKGKNKNNKKTQKQSNKQTHLQSKNTNKDKLSNGQQKKVQNKKNKQVIDIKMVKKFNKDCLRENKAIELNANTERFILYGLSQKDNVLTRYEDNYEKIANMLCLVVLNKKNLKNKDKKKGITLNTVYDIIFNQTSLKETETEFIALCLEILSVIENMKSPLYLVSVLSEFDILSKYLLQMPQIDTVEIMTEFVEYGL